MVCGYWRVIGRSWIGFVAWLMACEGQSQASGGGDDAGMSACEASGETVDLDAPLPEDFTRRALVDAVAGEREVPAFRVGLSDELFPAIQDEIRVRVTVAYKDGPVPVLDCPIILFEPYVPVDVTIEELDGDARWEFAAIVNGTPERATVTSLPRVLPEAFSMDGGLASLAAGGGLALHFQPEGFSGVVHDLGGGAFVRLGAACGGHTELSPDEIAEGWEAAPATLATALDGLPLSAQRDGERSAVTFAVDGLSPLACYLSSAPFGEPRPMDGSLPPLRPMAALEMQASVALGAGQLAFDIEDASLSLWPAEACPVQGDDLCLHYQLRGCADVTGDEAVAALYPDEEVQAASACLYLEGVSGVSTTVAGQIEVQADLDPTDDAIRFEGDRVVWEVGL